MEPPLQTREQYYLLEKDCLEVCRQFLLYTIPVDVVPPGKEILYKSRKFANHTDYWLTATRLKGGKTACLSYLEQRRDIRDGTSETMQTVPKVLSLLESLLVSFRESKNIPSTHNNQSPQGLSKTRGCNHPRAR